MDDELKELERELQNLRPLAPGRELLARLENELGPRRRSPSWLAWISIPALAGAAALILLVARDRPVDAGRISLATAPAAAAPALAQSSTPVEAAFKPVQARDLLYSSNDIGYVTLKDGTQAHGLVDSYVDTVTWENPQTHASLEWTAPREQFRVIQASFQ
jgi:hypothetical protein